MKTLQASVQASDGVSEDMIRSYFERWRRLEAEKDAISQDLRELFAEMKGNGFDTKVVRKVFRDKEADPNERSEFEAIYDLYWAALSGPRAGRAREGVKTAITEPQSQPAAQSQGNLSAPDASPDRREGDDDGQPIQPETATQSTAARKDVPNVEADTFSASHTHPQVVRQDSEGRDAAIAGTQAPPVDTHSNSVSTEPPSPPTEGEGGASSALPETSPALATIAEVNRARPSICQNPDACHSSSWRLPCFGCRKAAESEVA